MIFDKMNNRTWREGKLQKYKAQRKWNDGDRSNYYDGLERLRRDFLPFSGMLDIESGGSGGTDRAVGQSR